MADTETRFIPALGLRALTPIYDAVIRVGMREARLRDALLDDAAVVPGMRALDLACGTGSLAVRLKSREARAEVVGVDVDPEVLVRARRKADAAAVEITFAEGSIVRPLAHLGSFDRVFASLVLHHLSSPDRERALRQAYEVLRPGGRVHVADFAPPRSRRMRLAFLAVQALDGFATTADFVRGTVPRHLATAGFADVQVLRTMDTAFGTVGFWSATCGSR